MNSISLLVIRLRLSFSSGVGALWYCVVYEELGYFSCHWFYVCRVVSSIFMVLGSMSSAVLFPFSFLIICTVLSLSLFLEESVLLQLKFFFFSLETSSSVHGLFRNVLYSFQVFGDFPFTSLLFTLNFIMITAYMLYISNPFLKVFYDV